MGLICTGLVGPPNTVFHDAVLEEDEDEQDEGCGDKEQSSSPSPPPSTSCWSIRLKNCNRGTTLEEFTNIRCRNTPTQPSPQFQPSNQKSSILNQQQQDAMNPYHILQIRRDATMSELKQSYRRLALWHHPGRLASSVHGGDIITNPNNNKQELYRRWEMFELVAASYETLTCSESKRRLDGILQLGRGSIPTMTLPKGEMFVGGKRLLASSSAEWRSNSQIHIGSSSSNNNNNNNNNSHTRSQDTTINNSSSDSNSHNNTSSYNSSSNSSNGNNKDYIFRWDDNDNNNTNTGQCPNDDMSLEAQHSLEVAFTRSLITVAEEEEEDIGDDDNDENDGNRNENNERHREGRIIRTPPLSRLSSSSSSSSCSVASNNSESEHDNDMTINENQSPSAAAAAAPSSNGGKKKNRIEEDDSSVFPSLGGCSSAAVLMPKRLQKDLMQIFLHHSTTTCSSSTIDEYESDDEEEEEEEEADRYHYTQADTNRLFGGPLASLYRARNYQPFTNPFVLFETLFGGSQLFQHFDSFDIWCNYLSQHHHSDTPSHLPPPSPKEDNNNNNDDESSACHRRQISDGILLGSGGGNSNGQSSSPTSLRKSFPMNDLQPSPSSNLPAWMGSSLRLLDGTKIFTVSRNCYNRKVTRTITVAPLSMTKTTSTIPPPPLSTPPSPWAKIMNPSMSRQQQHDDNNNDNTEDHSTNTATPNHGNSTTTARSILRVTSEEIEPIAPPPIQVVAQGCSVEACLFLGDDDGDDGDNVNASPNYYYTHCVAC